MTDFKVRLHNSKLQDFVDEIKHSVIDAVKGDRFSAIRLKNARVEYNDEMSRKHRLGETDGTVAKVREVIHAMQLAETIVHEMAHILVGTGAGHNEDWIEAAKYLGLTNPSAVYQEVTEESFTPPLLEAIRRTLARLVKEMPEVVFDADTPIPWPAGKVAMPFQEDNIRKMLMEHDAQNLNTLLADEMGLGKTVTVMGYINVKHPKTILIVCPNNIKLVWKRHFEEWCIHPYKVEVASSQLYLFSDVVIMNYEAATKWGPALQMKTWDLVVFDEMHYLKNPSSKRAKTCYRIFGEKAVGVTGTLIVNYPDEAFPILHYLYRTEFPEFERYRHEYMGSSDRFGRTRYLNRLNAKLRSSIMLRHAKKDVLTDLPKKRRQIIEWEVPEEMRSLVESELKLFRALSGENSYDVVKMLNSLKNESDAQTTDFDWGALIEALTTTKQFAFEEMSRIAHEIGRAKVPLVIDHVTNVLENREKVAIFGHHRDVLKSIADAFPGSALVLGGNTDQGDVLQQAAKRFSEDDKCNVFVSGIKLAQGYSLAAGSTVVFCEEDWVPGNMTQAEDRMHGIGRGDHEARSLLIQHLVFEDSLDTVKAKLAIKKQQSMDKVMR